MISLHEWNVNGYFVQYDFIDEKALVEWLLTFKVVFSKDIFERGYKENDEDRKQAIADLHLFGIDTMIDVWDGKENANYMRFLDIKELIKNKNVKTYYGYDFAYEFYSIHTPPRLTPP